MSLEEEQLPPSIRGGKVPAVQMAWEGNPSLESSQGAYNTLESEVSMQEISGGEGYWSREGEGTSEHSLAQQNEKLKEDLMAARVEVMKYKHQVESRCSPNPRPRQSPDGSEGEVSKQESELDIARQKIEELEQEVLLGELLLAEKPSPNPSVVIPSQNGGEHSNILQTRTELEQKVNVLHSQGNELNRVRGELGKVESERDEVSNELCKVKVEHDEVRGELQSTQAELEQVKSELRSKEAELVIVYNNPKSIPNGDLDDYSKEELEKAKRELESTQMELEEARKSLHDKEGELVSKEEELERAQEELKRKATPRKSPWDSQISLKLNVRCVLK